MVETAPMRDKIDLKTTLFNFMAKVMNDCHDVYALEDDISIFESTLAPYSDDIFEEDLTKIKDKYIIDIQDNAFDFKNGKENSNKAEKYRKEAIIQRYRAIMNLARRKGLLPEESISHVMGEEL